jgi:hypothetical protein
MSEKLPHHTALYTIPEKHSVSSNYTLLGNLYYNVTSDQESTNEKYRFLVTKQVVKGLRIS